MYITPNQYSATFKEIRRSSTSHSTCKLILFVSCLNIDALCAAKILSVLLRKELIQYQMIPVVGYSDLKRHYERIDADVTNVILIGCGAMLDLETFFELNVDELLHQDHSTENSDDLDVNDDLKRDPSKNSKIKSKRKIYIIDGHRPWNLDNLFGSNIVVCFDDGFVDANLTHEKSSYTTLVEKFADMDDDEDSSSSEEEDDDDEEDGDEFESEKIKESEFDDTDDDEEIIFNSQDSEDTTSRKRKRQEHRVKKLRKQTKNEKSQHENVVQNYYNQGTTIITANSITIYALLSAIGETNIEYLWLSIIGTSSLDNDYPNIYDKLQPLLKDEVLRLKPSNNSVSNNNGEKTADSTTLNIELDYHLFLLRHWTLYDSFFYSPQVNAKLNLWTEEGKKKLHKMFATMGVSLAMAQQKWLYMDVRVKKQLPFIFNRYLPKYGLESIVREGFIRTFGYSGQLSAMECVESLTALFEVHKRLLGEKMGNNIDNNSDDEGDDEDDNNEGNRIQAKIERREKSWVNNFWLSWDALSTETSTINTNKTISSNFKKSKGFDLLLQGLDHAKIIQQVVFKTGTSVLDRKLVTNLRLYRLCVLDDGSIPDLDIFNNPLMLNKLGSWLMENITELYIMDSKSSLKPLVVASLDVSSDTYLVIGLAPKYPRGMDNSTRLRLAANGNGNLDATVTTRLNTFSVAFQQLANTSGAKIRIDSFDSSVIEIRKDDLPPFLEKLTLSGLI
ncbi:CDC45 family [Scheffersomyces coipomensis]|uniref:CDC45 family n=1 Tax=Scheffersomyces coipomensis TaxID=1788519 RepID=UPI00315D5C27